jgi:hypothetical protein
MIDVNMPHDEYRALEHLGSTDISRILENAALFHAIRSGTYQESKEAFEFGRAFHLKLLEPEKFEDEVMVVGNSSLRLQEIARNGNFLVAPCRGKTAKVYKEMVEAHPDQEILIEQEAEIVMLFAENAGKAFITQDTFHAIERCVKNALAVKGFADFIAGGRKEQSYEGEIDGVKVKARCDLVVDRPGGKVLVFDPKTTGKDATERTFVSSSAAHGYYRQEWLYTEVLRQNGILAEDYIFLLCSSLEYSGAQYYKHGHIEMERAEEEVKKAVQKYKYCRDHDEWGEGKFNYAENKFEIVSEVTLPTYIFYRYE